ncbi:MAG: DUF599 domain-containing protein [Rubrivivax sp.]|nr:DUF599 domain-containing protein [Rubrivivax sp.]
MDTLASLWRVLPWPDWVALALFFVAWVGYARFAHRRATTKPSLLALTNRERTRWMLQATWRDTRVIDGSVVQTLSASPSFFASTTILIIGGLLAVLSTTDKASDLVREIPFAARTSMLVFDLKVVLLMAIFVYAFFRFTWSLRQYGFGALLLGAAPLPERYTDEALRTAFASRAGRVMGLAAEAFNDGLRAYYMSFAAVAWFSSPWALMAGTAGVIFVLYRREFHSDVLAVLAADGTGP